MSNTATSTGRGRRWWTFGAGGILALMAIILWRPLQQEFLAFLLVRADGPSDQVLSDFVEKDYSPQRMLMRLWSSHRIPQRRFVADYVARTSPGRPELFHTTKPLLIEATADPDLDVRQAAFGALVRMKQPELYNLARAQLGDADPAVRILGLQSLRRIATSNDVPEAMQFLSDPEPRVVVAAAQVLKQVTGQDFGLKTALALPQFTCIDTSSPPAPDVPAISQGVQRWHDWWKSNQTEYPRAVAAAAETLHARSFQAPDFKLPDVSGRPRRLSDYRGRTVLLAFWSLGVPASLDDMPSFEALVRQKPDDLAILGICVPAAESCGDEHEGEHEHGQEQAHHHHGEACSEKMMLAQVQEMAARLKIDLPMLLDAKGDIGRRYKAEDLPLYVLIDREGMIRRRFAGFRSGQAIQAMVEEISGPGPGTAKPLARRQALVTE